LEIEVPCHKKEPLVIQIPAPFPYESTKAVPWNYSTSAYVQGKPVVIPEQGVTSIDGPGKITRTGRVYSPEISAKNTFASVPSSSQKSPVVDTRAEPSKGKDKQEEVDEFLRIIRKSDYKVVDQLNQTPSKISILSLLMNSEAHRTALLKLLNMAHVNQDITVDQFDGVCNNITASRCLGFVESELPSEGYTHNKALHISIRCQDNNIARVLVYTGSSLNVLPKSTLLKLSLLGPTLRSSNLIVKAFDGSQREVIGEIELPIFIGPQLFNITFQVMDINPSYSCLLGRPWIHAAGAVTSTLHQKLKFVSDNKLITVSGEEDTLVSHLTSFKYVESDEGALEIPFQALEIPFQALEIASVTLANPEDDGRKEKRPVTSLKSLKVALEEGLPTGLGQMLVLPEKKDRFGLGYQSSKGIATPKKIQDKIPKIEDVFSSAGYRVDGHIAMIDDKDAVEKNQDWVRQCSPETVLTNWKAVGIPEVVFFSN
jgi:hypothetical protein